MKLLSSDIAGITGGTLEGRGDVLISSVTVDSRQISYTEGNLFIALKGPNHDGHSFIRQLYDSGLRCFIVERDFLPGSGYEGASFISVDNSLDALQLLAAHVRRSFSSPVIAVTGSAGKTIVKEWLAEIAGYVIPLIRSPRSYNSQVGVPLSVLKLDNKYRLGIFEAGISRPGEMEKLREIINPEIGIITNIGEAHSENFSDLKGKAREKLKLFRNAEVVIYCRDHTIIHEEVISDPILAGRSLISWSYSDRNAEAWVSAQAGSDSGSTGFDITYRGSLHGFEVPFIDRASIENAITVAVASLYLEISPDVISKGLKRLSPVAMRMNRKAGLNNCLIIEDYYNSDPGSLAIALEYLSLQKKMKRTLILSDFLQSGREEKDLYGEIAELIMRTGVDRFIGIGEALLRNRHLFGPGARFYSSTDEFIRLLVPGDFSDEAVLLKGARMFEFERIGVLLEEKIHQTVLEVNLDAVASNLNEFRKHLSPGTGIMAMVKAFAYGAGPSEIASLLQYHRINYLAVAYADEGIELRNAGVTMPVMVMNPDPGSSDLLIRHNLEPEIFSFSSLDRFSEAAFRQGVLDYPVHIKIDTGMHRLGFLPAEAGALALKLKGTPSVRVRSVLSHLAASEDEGKDEFTHRQVATFVEITEKLKAELGYGFIRHILNSAGIFRFPSYQFEMVRPGIAIYGIGSYDGISLRPAGRFITRISQVKTVPADEPVGYGCSDVSKYDRVIAILPVGYADGLSRRLGNRNGSLFIRGRRAALVGNICMDMCMADVSGIDAREGDEAEIFGKNISIEEVAAKCGTIPYEILTSIPGRVKRVFFRE